MRIVLHIGQSKTGTSAIQSFLTLNRAHLKQKGILFPGLKIGGMPVDLGSHNAVADALVGLSRYPNLTSDEYFEQFFKEADEAGSRLMILSAEHFFGGEPRVWDVRNEKEYFLRYRSKVMELAKYLKGHEVVLLVYLRPQVEWLASAIGQTVRTERLIGDGVLYHDDYKFFEMVKPWLRYCSLIDVWAECLNPSELMVVPYERKSLYKESSIADFMYRVGLAGMDLPIGSDSLQVNNSLTREYIEVKKIINRRARSKNEERVAIRCLEKLSSRSRFPSEYTLPDDLIRQVESFVEAENARLNERYINGGSPVKARSDARRAERMVNVSEDDISAALAEYEREYSSLRSRLMLIDYVIRDYLRKNVKPLHSALHQLKRFYRWNLYRR